MRRALLVIDVQNEYFSGKLPVSYPKGNFENIIRVIESAHSNNIQIIFIQHTARQQDAITFRKGSSEWELHPKIMTKPYNYILEKHLPGSFTGTNLESLLIKDDVDTVVICGYMTQMCCDTTARQAFHLGYNVEFLSDATGTLQISNYAGTVTAEELHRSVLITQAMKFSKVLSSNEWIGDLRNEKTARP